MLCSWCEWYDPIARECIREVCVDDRCREDVTDNDDVGRGKQGESTESVQ